jgi:hypothetical protein
MQATNRTRMSADPIASTSLPVEDVKQNVAGTTTSEGPRRLLGMAGAGEAESE